MGIESLTFTGETAMKRTDTTIQSTNEKNQLHVIIWEPEDDPKAVVQLVHGMAEYMDRYHEFASYLTDRGYAVIGHDHLGHGKTVNDPSELGFFAKENGDRIVIMDMYGVTRLAQRRWPDKPVFILGHSMGSFMVRKYITKYSDEIAGAVVMGTGFQPAAAADMGIMITNHHIRKHGHMYVSKTVNNMAMGGYNKKFKPNRTPVDWLSVNEENVDQYMADELCGFNFTVSAYNDFFHIIKDLAESRDSERISRSLSVLITSGEVDPVGGVKACMALEKKYKKMGMEDVEVKIFPGDRHEILNENDKDVVFREMGDWFDSKL